MSGQDQVERAEKALLNIIPDEALRHGWTLRGVTYVLDAAAEERYSVEAYGPMETYTEHQRFVGGETAPLLFVLTGRHGTIEARTVDDLVRLVRQWIESVWGAR